MHCVKVKVTEVREAVIELDPSNYSEEDRTLEGMLRVERESSEENFEYMDIIDASSVITFDIVE